MNCDNCIHEKICAKWGEIYTSKSGTAVRLINCEYFIKNDKIPSYTISESSYRIFEFKVGHCTITLNVSTFFVDANISQINKMLKLVNENCSCRQKKKLFDDLYMELIERETSLGLRMYASSRSSMESQCKKLRKIILRF